MKRRLPQCILVVALCLISAQVKAGSLNDLESASLDPNQKEFQVAALPTFPKAAPPAAKDEILYPPLFGVREVRSSTLASFPKWTSVIARYDIQKLQPKTGAVANWNKFLGSIQHKSQMEQLVAVNNYMNKVRYASDKSVWGINDYWQTPAEFLEGGRGDCEDYAIAKFASLRELGIPANAMRIVIVNDEHIKNIHAILVVYLQGQAYILDNQIKQIVTTDSIHHYRPIYSINEHSWWKHKA